MDIVVHVPFVTARNAALMSSNERQPARELVDVELQRLRDACVLHPEVNVVSEIVESRNERTKAVTPPRDCNHRQTLPVSAAPETHDIQALASLSLLPFRSHVHPVYF